MPTGLKRFHTQGHDHFITFSCYRRLPYLDDDHSRKVFEEVLERTRQSHQFFLHGYVLMPEHVHLLMSEPQRFSLATTLGVIKGEASKLLKGDRKQFWQLRYHDFNVFTRPKHREKTPLHAPQPGQTGPRRRTRTLAMEQLLSLPHGRTGQHRNRIRLDLEPPSRRPTHRITPR